MNDTNWATLVPDALAMYFSEPLKPPKVDQSNVKFQI